MSSTNKINQFSPPNIETMIPINSVFSLSEPPLVEHVLDTDTDKEYLRIAETVSYPHGYNTQDPIAELILPAVSNHPNLIALPSEYLTLQHILNEASGASVELQGDIKARTTGEAAFEGIFDKIGSSVGRLASQASMVPEVLDYHRIIVEQSDEGAHVRLLPPADFTSVDDPTAIKSAINEAGGTLRRSLYDNAVNNNQRRLTELGMDAFGRAVNKSLKEL